MLVFHKLAAAQIEVESLPAESDVGAYNYSVTVKNIRTFNQIIDFGVTNAGAHGVIWLRQFAVIAAAQASFDVSVFTVNCFFAKV